jgi:hypothetical protein
MDSLKLEMKQKIFELDQRIEEILNKMKSTASKCRLNKQEHFFEIILKFFENLVRIFK